MTPHSPGRLGGRLVYQPLVQCLLGWKARIIDQGEDQPMKALQAVVRVSLVPLLVVAAQICGGGGEGENGGSRGPGIERGENGGEEEEDD